MNLSNSQLDLGLNLDYDEEKQEKPEFQERLKVYKYATRFKIINYSCFILQSVNVLILWSFLYWDFISKLTSKSTDSRKYI